MDFHEMGRAVRQLPLFNLVTAFSLYGLVLLLGCLRWVLLLHAFQIRVRFNLAFQLLFIGLFFNNMMPSLTGGDVVKGYYTAKGTSKKMEAVASILLDRFFGFCGMFTLAAVGSLFAWSHPVLGGAARIVLVGIFIFFLSVILFLNQKIFGRVRFLKNVFDKIKGRDGIVKFYEALTGVKHHRGTVLKVWLLSIIIQALLVIVNFLLARGLGISGVSFGQFFVIIPIAACISAMPISFAGWGIGEGAYRSLFMMFNPAYGAVAVILSIVYRLICLIYSLAGLPLYLMYREGAIEKEVVS